MSHLKGKIKLNPKKTAVLVIDMQNGCCSPKGFSARILKKDLTPVVSMAKKIPAFLNNMRKKGVEIIWLRTDYQAKSVPRNVYESETLAHGDYPFPDVCKKGTSDYEYYSVKPKRGEREFIKNQPNAFSNKKLYSYLKKRKINTIILIGVWASQCVFCSMVGSSTRGYRTIMVKDLTTNPKETKRNERSAYSIAHGMLGFVLTSKEVLELF